MCICSNEAAFKELLYCSSQFPHTPLCSSIELVGLWQLVLLLINVRVPNSQLFLSWTILQLHLGVLQLNPPCAKWICQKLRPKFLDCSFSVSSYASVFLSRTGGPVVACFYFQYMYAFQIPNCSSVEQSRNCTLEFLSWVFLVQNEFVKNHVQSF